MNKDDLVINKSIKTSMSSLKITLYSGFFFIALHTIFYCIEQLHYSFCTPYGLSGFVQSFFTSRSTICNALKVVSWHASAASVNMMSLSVSVIGGVIMNKLLTGT